MRAICRRSGREQDNSAKIGAGFRGQGEAEIMQRDHFLTTTAAAAAVAATLFIVLPAAAQAPTEASAPSPAATAAIAAPAAIAPRCEVPVDQAHFDRPLARTRLRLAAGLPIKIVAIGSSSTAGAGASSSASSYPSRLEVELARQFPGHEITVLNRGVNGEEAADMVARFDTSVVAENPDLVLWQVGTNSLLRQRPLDPRATVLHQGLARLKEIHADVVLIDPQFAPKVITKPGAEAMVALIAQTAKLENVDLFRRFAMMRYWLDVDGLSFANVVSADGLHMNDWSYACLAKWLGFAIAEAATRPTETAAVPR